MACCQTWALVASTDMFGGRNDVTSVTSVVTCVLVDLVFSRACLMTRAVDSITIGEYNSFIRVVQGFACVVCACIVHGAPAVESLEIHRMANGHAFEFYRHW